MLKENRSSALSLSPSLSLALSLSHFLVRCSPLPFGMVLTALTPEIVVCTREPRTNEWHSFTFITSMSTSRKLPPVVAVVVIAVAALLLLLLSYWLLGCRFLSVRQKREDTERTKEKKLLAIGQIYRIESIKFKMIEINIRSHAYKTSKVRNFSFQFISFLLHLFLSCRGHHFTLSAEHTACEISNARG